MPALAFEAVTKKGRELPLRLGGRINMTIGSLAGRSEQLLSRGFVVLEGLSNVAVQKARKCIIENAHLLKNTRPNVSSGHIAGFHRYPDLEPLHALVSSNPVVLDILRATSGCSLIRSIGLSDITVNRSQEWHVDLLRGRYQSHLTPEICWGPRGGGVYKALLYLQAGATLKVVPGAHTRPTALDDDRKCEPGSSAETEAVAVPSGGIVLMDIRLPHRGSSEEELRNTSAQDSKMLVSTVLVGDKLPLGEAMERGNFERLLDWDALHRDHESPQISRPKQPLKAAAQS